MTTHEQQSTDWLADAVFPSTEDEAKEYFRALPPDLFIMLMQVGIDMMNEWQRMGLRSRLIREGWCKE